MTTENQFTYQVIWSEEDAEFVGLCDEFPSISWLAASSEEAITGIQNLVADVLADMEKSGEEKPTPGSQ